MIAHGDSKQNAIYLVRSTADSEIESTRMLFVTDAVISVTDPRYYRNKGRRVKQGPKPRKQGVSFEPPSPANYPLSVTIPFA